MRTSNGYRRLRDGADSPFATALAKHLTEPGIEVDKMFRLVIDDVFDLTGNKQEPFMYGSLPGRQNFYFQPRSKGLSRQASRITTRS
jgi:hypothetical protein